MFRKKGSSLPTENISVFGIDSETIVSLKLNNDGSIIAAIYSSGKILIWDTKSETILYEFCNFVSSKGEQAYYRSDFSIDFCINSKYLAVGTKLGHVKIFELTHGTLMMEKDFYPNVDYEKVDLFCYYNIYTQVCFSESGNYLIIYPSAYNFDPQDSDGIPSREWFTPKYLREFFVLKIDTCEVVFDYIFNDKLKGNSKIGCVSMSRDDIYISAGIFGTEIKVWELSSKKEAYKADDFVWVDDPCEIGMRETIIFCGNNRLCYANKYDEIQIIDLPNTNNQHTIKTNQKFVTCLCYNQINDTILFTCHTLNGSTLSKYSLKDYSLLSSTHIHSHYPRNIAINNENNLFFMLFTPTVESRRLDNLKMIEIYDPYVWFKSEYMLGSPVSISKNGASMVIANEGLFYYSSPIVPFRS